MKFHKKSLGWQLIFIKKLGPGLLENVYKECLFYKINQSGLLVAKKNQCH